MAVSVDNNRTYRLRDLRENAVSRDKSELRPPSRRPKFEDRLTHPGAGQIVGEFPDRFDKTKNKQHLRRNPLEVAAKRQQPRQAVAALMAREGISTFTKFGAKAKSAERAPSKEKEKGDDKAFGAAAAGGPSGGSAWMSLLDDAPKRAEKSASDRAIEERLKRLSAQEKELNHIDKFAKEVDGTSMISQYMRKQDARVAKEAGRLERSSSTFADTSGLRKSKEQMNIELMKKEMAMNQQLNIKYLELQEKLQRDLTSLLSNLLKTRSECTKNSISGGG